MTRFGSLVTQLPSADEVSRELREILAGPDFATIDEAIKWRAIGWVLAKLRDLWNWLRAFMGEDVPWLAEVLVILVPLTAVLIAVSIASRGAADWTGAGKDDDEEAAAATPVTAREWLGLASRRAGQGDFRPAATALYQGFLLTLEQQGVVSFHGSKTPGDYALEIAHEEGGGDAAAIAGGRFLDSFQDFSFGQARPTTVGYAGLEHLARDAGCPAGMSDTEPGP